jgi:hypothetical protein
LETSTISNKKYVDNYKKQKNTPPPPSSPLVGCVYQGKTTSNNKVIGVLMECGEANSTIKDKHGKSHVVLSNTLLSIQ